MTVPTLILIGERDDWGTANACRKMVAGEDDLGMSRQKGGGATVRLIVYPGAYSGFDNRPSRRQWSSSSITWNTMNKQLINRSRRSESFSN